MINFNKKFDTIEDLIFDSNLIEMSKRNDADEIDKFLLLYPDKQEEIRAALVLLRHMNIKLTEVSDMQIEEDWDKLQQKINAKSKLKKNIRFYIWNAIAASAVVLLLIFFGPSSKKIDIDNKENLYTLLESADISGDEVQIIAGTEQAKIDNNETIIQTKEGSVVVGKEEKLESTNIKTEYLTVTVPTGKRTTIRFSDGTKAWVNSGSKVVYPKVFGDKEREVIVDGEMYLDVAKNPDKPFIVRTTKGFDIRVLGTKFNVNAYNSDANNSVVLVEGAVEVTTGSSKGKLEPNQGFFVKGESFSIKNVDVYSYICWKDNVMKLEGESLNVIFDRLARYYGVNIQYSEKFINEKYKGKIDLKEPIETVLTNISVSTPIWYERKGDIIVVR